MTRIGPIGEKMVQVQRILKFIKAILPSAPLSAKQIYEVLKADVTGMQQVLDTLVYYYNKGELSRIREGGRYLYWGKQASPAGLSPVQPKEILKSGYPFSLSLVQPNPAVTPAVPQRHISGRPEIRVEQDRIIIEHAKCRIVVELS